jgi:hypothetical protein
MRVYFQSKLSNCFRCGGVVRSVGVNWVRYITGCGYSVDAFREFPQLVVPRHHFALVEKFLATELGRSLGCELVLWDAKGEGERGWYRCPNCRVLAVSLLPFAHERAYTVEFEVKERILREPHWCIGGRYGLCSDATDAPLPHAWLADSR